MKKIISPYVLAGIHHPDHDDILPLVCLVTGLTIDQIKSKSKKGLLSDARCLATMLFLKRGLGLQHIATKMDLVNHTSIIYHRNKFNRLITNKHDILYKWATKIKVEHNIDLFSKTVANTRNYQ